MGAFLSGKTVSALVNRWYSLRPDQKANCSDQAAHCTFHAQRLGGITVQSIYHLHKRLCAEKRHAGFNMADMCSPHISHRSQPLLRQVFSLRGQQISNSRFAAHLSRTRRQKRTILPRRTLPCFFHRCPNCSVTAKWFFSYRISPSRCMRDSSLLSALRSTFR